MLSVLSMLLAVFEGLREGARRSYVWALDSVSLLTFHTMSETQSSATAHEQRWGRGIFVRATCCDVVVR